MGKYFLKSTKIALILVYLVIVAGALVRMTGSGMGCPDWPKCFGYYIPPTNIEQLQWTPNREFKKGQVIIKDEKLIVAKEDFVTTENFEENNWEIYTKHDYAKFNAKHTWVEFLNRLMGAIAGIGVFVMFILSIFYKNKQLLRLTLATTLLMGFQAWLGAKVVYSVLNPLKITLHMVIALVIVAIILHILKKLNTVNKPLKKDHLTHRLIIATLVLSLIQIILGTQVRQFVDEQVKLLGDQQMQLVLQNPNVYFYIHRTFSSIVFGLNAFLFLRIKKYNLGYNKINWVMLLLFLEIVSGVIVYNLDFPFGSQAIHLIIASILFGTQYYIYLEETEVRSRNLIL